MERMDILKNVKVENLVEEEPRDDVISLQLKEMRDLCDAAEDINQLCNARQDAAQLEECRLCLSVFRCGPAFFAHQGLPHPFPCLLQCGRHFPDLLLLHSHHLEHHRAHNMVAAAGLLFCPTCNQVWSPGSEEQHSPLHHLSCNLCPLVLPGGLKDTMVLHRWRVHGATGDLNPGDTFQPALPISSGDPSSTSHCSSAASTTISTLGSPRSEKSLKRKLECGDDEMLASQDCTEVRRGVIEEELKRCRRAQEGVSSKKHMLEADVILGNCLSQTSKQGPGFGEVFCHSGKANELRVKPLGDSKMDRSDESKIELIEEKTGRDLQMMPCNSLIKEDVPYWCGLCNVQLPEDTPQVRRMHNRGKRHQAALRERHHKATPQEIRAHWLEEGWGERKPGNLQSRITNDDKKTISALSRLGDKRSVVFVPKERRNVVARLGEKVLELTPQRKVQLLEEHHHHQQEQEQERLTDELSEQLSHELDDELGIDLRNRLRNRSQRYRNLDKVRTYQDLDKVETSERVFVERKVENYGKELEELSTKIQRAKYKKSMKSSPKDEVICYKRVVTFGRGTETQLTVTEARGQTKNFFCGHKLKSENKVTVSKGGERKKIVWP